MRHEAPHDPAAPIARADHRLRLSVQLRDPLEHWYLTRILETAARMGRLPVRFGAAPAQADIVIAAPDEHAASAPGPRAPGAGGPVLVDYAAEAAPGRPWLPRPGRTRDARRLLEDLQQRLRPVEAGGQGAMEAPLPFSVAGVDLVLPQLRRLMATGQDALLQSPLGISLLVLPRQHRLCSPLDADLAELCQALRAVRLQDVRPLAAAEAAKCCVETHRHAVSLEAVCWELCLEAIPVAASPALLEGLRLRLRGWPDFSLLPHRGEHLQWAARLTRERVALHELVQSSPDGLEPVARFLNACHILGLLEIVAPARADRHGV